MTVSASFLHLFLLVIISLSGASATTYFKLKNNCHITVWPGILSGAGQPLLSNGGLRLHPGQSATLSAPTGWSGRFWPRTHCQFDSSHRFSCLTGDCGGARHCSGAGGTPPVSLAEFTLNSPIDYYDVSLVDGYNLPISVIPSGSSGGHCKPVKCVADLNQICPKPLQVVSQGKVVACKSACMAFGKPEYCCTSQFGSPQTCKPTLYSRLFKRACPRAYSYAFDDATSTFTCVGANYLIKFC